MHCCTVEPMSGVEGERGWDSELCWNFLPLQYDDDCLMFQQVLGAGCFWVQKFYILANFVVHVGGRFQDCKCEWIAITLATTLWEMLSCCWSASKVWRSFLMYFTLQWLQGSKLLILGILEEEVSRRGIDITDVISRGRNVAHTLFFNSVRCRHHNWQTDDKAFTIYMETEMH